MTFTRKEQNVVAERVDDMLHFCRCYEDLPQWIQDTYPKEEVSFGQCYIVLRGTILTKEYVVVRDDELKVFFYTWPEFKKHFKPKIQINEKSKITDADSISVQFTRN